MQASIELPKAFSVAHRKLVVVPQITHFQMYIDEAFETGSNAAAAWFQEHLKN